ncbi:hypothetical protein H9Q72_005639 [Fusarium xylarioides]|uniref:Apple domain-containing protein n=1 Tax=Fusarium xylarioides TaxID=221167 RepID=A0A9P7L271_9HYPO|nr:hypothetical protein H9Q72_005639 [Fusarium xylarioides]
MAVIEANKTKQADHDVIVIFEPEGMKLALGELVEDHGIHILLHSSVISAERFVENIFTSVAIQERRGTTTLRARAFVDASGDGDLAYHAGASVRYGNHDTINLGTLLTRFGGLKNINPVAQEWRYAILQARADNPKLAVASVQLRLPQSGDIITYLAWAPYDARNISKKLPSHQDMHLVSSGPNFSTRESRRINAKGQLRVEDVDTGAHFYDRVAKQPDGRTSNVLLEADCAHLCMKNSICGVWQYDSLSKTCNMFSSSFSDLVTLDSVGTATGRKMLVGARSYSSEFFKPVLDVFNGEMALGND